MPVHSRGDKKETNHHDEMEVDYAENEGSSSEDEDTESSSVSEDGDSSEMDDEDCERRRMECLDEMSNLEKQFTDLKDQLYKERLSQVDAKLQEVIAGKAPEYLEPLATLQENMQIRTKVAGIYRELCLESVKNKYECEIQASRQHCESEKLLLYDTVQSELEEKIRRLEEDRHSIDITSELWNDELQSRKKRKDPFSPDKKKPVVVSDILFRISWLFFLFVFFKIYFIDFLQRGRKKDRELETSMREKHRSAASCTSPTGVVPATQVHALDRNRTWDLSVRRPTLYPLSQTGFSGFLLLLWLLPYVYFCTVHTFITFISIHCLYLQDL
uniref:BRMS1 like transcriptional repressor n=1 Tax=Myotis myotis TaxID=51298 RepID=A0A7J8AHQ0_MYOMY|nr:hypothetical protein mMyoMyo1_001575 [Myotis myotis]